MAKYLLYSFMLVLLCFSNKSNAQLYVFPEDILTCPTQPIELRARFDSDISINMNLDDNFSSPVDIGFDFVYYGQTYNQCVISGNNYITFNLAHANQGSSYVYNTALGNGQIANAIMFPFHDTDASQTSGNSITYATIGTPGNRKFIVQFCRVPLFSCNNLLVTNQLVLYEGSNRIEIHTYNKPGGCTWESGTGIMGLRSGTFEHLVPGRNLPNVNWAAQSEGLRFTPINNTQYQLDSIPFAPVPIIVEPVWDLLTWYKQGSNTPLGTGQSLTVTAEKNVNYYYAIYDGPGTCFDTTYYQFTDTAKIRFNNFSSNRTVEICAGETYNFFGEEIFTTGTYRKALTTPLGCDSTYILNLIVNPLPDATIGGNTNINLCEGYTRPIAVANPRSGQTYQWYKDGNIINGANQEVYVVKDDGKYHVVVTSNKGCVDRSEDIFITVNPNPTASIIGITDQNKTLYCNYDTITIAAVENPNYEYIWSPDKNFRNFNVVTSNATIKGQFRDPETEVTLVVRDQKGCMDTTSTMIRTQPCCEIFVPNAFTPNEDGLNDYFLPTLKPLQAIVSFVVYDRYGKLVYEWKGKSLGWDGTYPDGEKAATGTYMYQLIYSCDDGKNYTEKESIQLIR